MTHSAVLFTRPSFAAPAIEPERSMARVRLTGGREFSRSSRGMSRRAVMVARTEVLAQVLLEVLSQVLSVLDDARPLLLIPWGCSRVSDSVSDGTGSTVVGRAAGVQGMLDIMTKMAQALHKR